MDSKQYWDEKILTWEDSQTQGGHVPLIERAAALFRKPLIERTRLAFELLDPFVRGKTVLEVGCGSGYIALELASRLSPARITGTDFSARAIERASKMADEKGLSGTVTFQQSDACSAVDAEADITLGLGLLDYLSGEDLTHLFAAMKSSYFLFSFAERVPTVRRLLHVLYLKSQCCPKNFYYTEAEMRAFIGDRFGQVHFLRTRQLSFGCMVHNLPPAAPMERST